MTSEHKYDISFKNKRKEDIKIKSGLTPEETVPPGNIKPDGQIGEYFIDVDKTKDEFFIDVPNTGKSKWISIHIEPKEYRGDYRIKIELPQLQGTDGKNSAEPCQNVTVGDDPPPGP